MCCGSTASGCATPWSSFRGSWGRGASELIKQVTALQELLGAMQDAHVAEGLIVAFLTRAARPAGANKNNALAAQASRRTS